MTPFFDRDGITVYCGDVREVLPQLDLSEVGCVVADPPYGETELPWDRWPDGWALELADCVPQAAPLWCFGSMRMFLGHVDEFDLRGWKLAQDLIWEKHNGSGFMADRFKRVHESAVQFYRGAWGDVWKDPQHTNDATARTIRRKQRPQHMARINAGSYESEDGGPRLMRSVVYVRSEHGRAVHPTQKPIGIVEPLVRYSARAGSVVLDLFSGSGTTAVVAKGLGLRCIAIEGDERWCREIVGRLTQEMRFPATAARPAPITPLASHLVPASNGSSPRPVSEEELGRTPSLVPAKAGSEQQGETRGTLDLAAAGTPAQENGPTREGRDVEAASPSGVPRSPVAADSFRTTAPTRVLRILLVGEDGVERPLEVARG